MPVTQRWVHSGLIVAVVVFSMCLTILVLGASRSHTSDTGLPGSRAAGFRLNDSAELAVEFDVRAETNPIQVLVFAEHGSNELQNHASLINSLISTYRNIPTVRVLGISYVYDPSVLGAGARGASELEIHCPLLHTARDFDGSVARAYRVNSPTLFIIDQEGVIRTRMPLSQPSLMMFATDLINSLHQTGPSIQSLDAGQRASR
jgi:hypothetical protein